MRVGFFRLVLSFVARRSRFGALGVVALGLVMVAAPAGARGGGGGATWSVQRTPHVAGELSGVSCPSASICVAAGRYSGGPLVERWNGVKWSIQRTPSPFGGADLHGVSCTSAAACTAVGGSTEPLVERWDGRRWSIQRTRALRSGGFLYAVSCTAPSACMAVGSTGGPPNVPEPPLAERWNGRTWSVQHPPSTNEGATLTGVSCSSASACTAVGATSVSSLVVERWDGSRWSMQPSPNTDQGGVFLAGVSCTAASLCTAVGEQYAKRQPNCGSNSGCYPWSAMLAERWNGQAWSIQTTPHHAHSGHMNLLDGVSCASSAACTAVGSVIERWNGRTWAAQRAPVFDGPITLNAVSCTSHGGCTAVGTIFYPNDHPLIERWTRIG